MITYISEQELYELEATGESWDDDFLNDVGIQVKEGFDDPVFNDPGSKSCNCSSLKKNQYENPAEAFPLAALIPALTTALPMVISALPAIAQTAGSVIQSITKGIGGSPSVPPAPVPLPSKTSPSSAPADQLLQTLLNLLQNPQVMQTLGNLASGVASGIQTKTGNTVSPANLLNVVSQLSGNAAAQIASTPISSSPIPKPGETYFPDYVFDHNGKLLIDPGDPIQHGELLNEMITA